MISNKELRDIYHAIIVKSGHPDPVGYLARAFALSGGDVNYHDNEGRIGFYPVKPSLAFEIVGSNDVSSLQGNIISTLGMEIKLLSEMNYDDMVKTMLDGRKVEKIGDIADEIVNILNPRKAMVSDVIALLKPELDNKSGKLSKSKQDFFHKLLEYS